MNSSENLIEIVQKHGKYKSPAALISIAAFLGLYILYAGNVFIPNYRIIEGIVGIQGFMVG